MNVSRATARSPLNTWQPSLVFAVCEQTCHLNRTTWTWAEQLHAPHWIPDSQVLSFAVFERTCHLNMPTWTWAEQLHAPHWIPDSQVLSFAVFERKCHLNMPTWARNSHSTAICRGQVAKRTGIMHSSYTNCSSKTGSRRPSGKTMIPKHFLKGILKGKSSTPNWKNLLPRRHLQLPCSHYNMIYDRDLQNTIKIARLYWIPFEQPWRSHSIAICTGWIIWIATHYCRTHRFGAPVPMHKVSQHMQNTKAQHQQRREKSPGPLSYIARAGRDWFHAKAAARNRHAHEPTFLRNGTSVYPKKHYVLAFKSHPWCSSSNAICQQRLAKHKSSSNAICQQCLAKHNQNRRTILKNIYLALLYSWLHDLSRCMPTGHHDLWACENVTSWSFQVHAHWTMIPGLVKI